MSSSQIPDASPAVLALATAWVASVHDQYVGESPRFSIDGSGVLDIAAAAALLEDRPKPVWLTPVQSTDVLAIDTQRPLSSGRHTDLPFAGLLLTAGPPDERRILFVAGCARFRASPADMAAATSQYRVVAPCAAAGDYADSGFVDGLGLQPGELQDVAEVLVLGREADQGWVFPVVPSLTGNETS